MTKIEKYKRKDGFSELELLHAAADHLASAKILFFQNPRCLDSAGYLSHLGIELLLQALLLIRSDEFPNSHSLLKLSERFESLGGRLNYRKNHEETIRLLEGFYGLRYPRPVDPIEIDGDDWGRIEALFEFLVFALPKSIQEELKELDHCAKGNRILMWKEKPSNE